MIGWLRGRVLSRDVDGEVLLDVGGVGYRVSVPTPVLTGLVAGGAAAEVELFVHTHVREDAIILYGFTSPDERRSFEALLSAHGVGPSLALAVLSALRPEALARAVLGDDLDLLCSVPGIGKKTAQRLVLDLKSKLDLPDRSLPGTGPGPAGSSALGEVRAALGELGYAPEEIRRALDGVPEEGQVEELLRLALRELAVAR